MQAWRAINFIRELGAVLFAVTDLSRVLFSQATPRFYCQLKIANFRKKKNLILMPKHTPLSFRYNKYKMIPHIDISERPQHKLFHCIRRTEHTT